MSLNENETIEDIEFKNVTYTPKNKMNKKELEKDITKRIKLINEDRNNARELIKFKDSFLLLLSCITLLTILSVFCDIKNNRVDTTIEVLKALIFSISGYLFSKIDKREE